MPNIITFQLDTGSQMTPEALHKTCSPRELCCKIEISLAEMSA